MWAFAIASYHKTRNRTNITAACSSSGNSSFWGARSFAVQPKETATYRCVSHGAGARLSMTLHNQKPSKPRIRQRLLASAMYLVPFLDVLAFGKFIFGKIPLLKTLLLDPVAPLLLVYRGPPFVAFAVFLIVYFLIGKNMRFSYFVRYNAHQAILLDMVILIPQLLLALMSNFPPFIEEAMYNAVFYGMVAAVFYSVSRIVQGILPTEIPVVSDAVVNQVGPGSEDDY